MNLFEKYNKKYYEGSKGGLAEFITQETFRREFNQLARHLRQRHYTSENMARLHELAYKMDDAWEAMDYLAFKKTIDAMIQVEGEEGSHV